MRVRLRACVCVCVRVCSFVCVFLISSTTYSLFILRCVIVFSTLSLYPNLSLAIFNILSVSSMVSQYTGPLNSPQFLNSNSTSRFSNCAWCKWLCRSPCDHRAMDTCPDIERTDIGLGNPVEMTFIIAFAYQQLGDATIIINLRRSYIFHFYHLPYGTLTSFSLLTISTLLNTFDFLTRLPAFAPISK